MRALILAAGRGSRLGALTEPLPKGLVPLAGQPLIAWQLDALRAACISEIAIVRGYRGACFEFAVSYFDNHAWASTTMVGSLATAASWLAQDTTIVSYADLVYPARAIRCLSAAPGDIAVLYDPDWLALWRQRFEDPLSDAETFRLDERGARLLELGRRALHLDQIEGQYMGLLKLSPRGSALLLSAWAALGTLEQATVDLTALLSRLIDAGAEISAVRYDSWWCEIDQPKDLEVAERIVARETTR